MSLNLSLKELNTIEVALTHLRDMHSDIVETATDEETREWSEEVVEMCERLLNKIG